MIVENPYTPPHYLTMFFPIKPRLIDQDRTLNGDYYKKPTQFWFVNCEPEQNMFFEALEPVKTITVDKSEKMNGKLSRKVKRSLIHPQYARRFIRSHIYEPNEEKAARRHPDGKTADEKSAERTGK